MRELADLLAVGAEGQGWRELARALSVDADPAQLSAELDSEQIYAVLATLRVEARGGPRGRARLRRLVTAHQCLLVFTEEALDLEGLDAVVSKLVPGDDLLAVLLEQEVLSRWALLRWPGLPPDSVGRRLLAHLDRLVETCRPSRLKEAIALSPGELSRLLRRTTNVEARALVLHLFQLGLPELPAKLALATLSQRAPSQSSESLVPASEWLRAQLDEAVDDGPEDRLKVEQLGARLLWWMFQNRLVEKPEAWSEWLRVEFRHSSGWLQEVDAARFVGAIFTEDDAIEILPCSFHELSKLCAATGAGLGAALAMCPSRVVTQVREHWLSTRPDTRFEKANPTSFSLRRGWSLLRLRVPVVTRQLAPLLMLDAALERDGSDSERELEQLRLFLDAADPEMGVAVQRLVTHIAAWQPSHPFAKRSAAADGAERYLLDTVGEHENIWSALLPGLLTQDRLMDLASLVVVTGTARLVEDVRQCVDDRPLESSLRARSILAVVEGHDPSSLSVSKAMASRIAAEVDRDHGFPTPLAVTSATWLADAALEAWLRNQATRAAGEFFVDQGRQLGKQEEALVENLVRTLRDQLAQRPSVWLPEPGMRPSLSVAARTHSKKEESTSNLDVALIVDVEIENRFALVSAVAVQAKKPVLDVKTEGWQIDIPQLRELMRYFPSAVYLLLRRDGLPIVVPSKQLMGLIRGTRREHQGSAMVHYVDVRAAAIPVAQFLVDLAIGLWIGRTDKASLEIAAGNHKHIHPEVVVEVEMRWSPQNN